ncbi:MAG: glycosyl transferase family 2 [Planctomycetaceae bacterium]|nr:glycosyl transferase family 2 [Planctomycetaceae bacterium]
MARELSIVIPAYNEGPHIGEVLGELATLLREHDLAAEIIVVDDGSSDDTGAAALRAGARVLRHRRNRGYGASLKTGIRAARHDRVAITDADGTYPMEYLPRMLDLLDEADMVVGARTGANVSVPLVRRPAKWALNLLANYVASEKIADLNSGLRVFRRQTVLPYFPILPDQFSWTTTITLALLCDKHAVRYVPIDYRARSGRSKIKPWDAGAFTMLILRMAVLFRPLRVFLPLVGLFLLYGGVKLIVDLRSPHENISATAVLALLSALMILLMGMVADVVVTRTGRLNPEAVIGAHDATFEEMSADGAGDGARGASEAGTESPTS